jgi:hypothetical protein
MYTCAKTKHEAARALSSCGVHFLREFSVSSEKDISALTALLREHLRREKRLTVFVVENART